MKNRQIKIAQPTIPLSVIPELRKIFVSGNLAQGEYVHKLERYLANYLNAPFCIAVSSGTAALHIALRVLGIGPGDEVITTPFTFISTASTILMVGAKPIFADIEDDSFLIDPIQIERNLTKKTKAVIAVDLFGQMANYQAICHLAKKYGFYVIEDSCQALGARQDQTPIGSQADIATLSFYATKPITSGEGGALIVNNKKFAEKAQVFRNIGRELKSPVKFKTLGENYRMTEIQAAILLAQFPKLNKNIKRRQENAEYLTQQLGSIAGIVTPAIKNKNTHIFSQYTIKIKKPYPLNRNQLQKKFAKFKIETKIYYPIPLHLQPLFSHLKYRRGTLPNSEQVAQEVLSVPVHQALSKNDLERIVKIIKEK